MSPQGSTANYERKTEAYANSDQQACYEKAEIHGDGAPLALQHREAEAIVNV